MADTMQFDLVSPERNLISVAAREVRLPGSEGDGVAAVLSGESPFAGKLPMPWYKDVTQIGTEYPEILFPLGYGLTY